MDHLRKHFETHQGREATCRKQKSKTGQPPTQDFYGTRRSSLIWRKSVKVRALRKFILLTGTCAILGRGEPLAPATPPQPWTARLIQRTTWSWRGGNTQVHGDPHRPSVPEKPSDHCIAPMEASVAMPGSSQTALLLLARQHLVLAFRMASSLCLNYVGRHGCGLGRFIRYVVFTISLLNDQNHLFFSFAEVLSSI